MAATEAMAMRRPVVRADMEAVYIVRMERATTRNRVATASLPRFWVVVYCEALLLVVALLASIGCAKPAGRQPAIVGTWERVEETGSASLLSSGMFNYYVFAVHGDVIASDGFCAGFLTTFDISQAGSLTLEQASREQRRIDALEEVRIAVGGISFTDEEEADDIDPPPTTAEVEAAHQRARSKSEDDRTELESVAFSYLSGFDEEHDCVNEFEITEVTANRLVLNKSNGTGYIRFKRKEEPLNPGSFYAAGTSDTEDP